MQQNAEKPWLKCIHADERVRVCVWERAGETEGWRKGRSERELIGRQNPYRIQEPKGEWNSNYSVWNHIFYAVGLSFCLLYAEDPEHFRVKQKHWRRSEHKIVCMKMIFCRISVVESSSFSMCLLHHSFPLSHSPFLSSSLFCCCIPFALALPVDTTVDRKRCGRSASLWLRS